MRLDASPRGGFGGDQHGILDGGHPVFQGRDDAEPVQVCAPGRPIGEDASHRRLAQPTCDDGSGEGAGAHIGQRFLVDDIIAMSGAQQFEEVQTAL